MTDIRSAIIGFCIGDALGVPHEFKPRSLFKQNPVTSMTGYGTHQQPPGTWSDDSSMTLCLLDSLSNGYDIRNISDKFLEWYYEGKYTPFGEVFDVGGTTRAALERIRAGIQPMDAGGRDERDNGNGSLMRVLPLVFFLTDYDDENKFRIINVVSSVTHAHIRSIIASSFYVEFGIQLLGFWNKEKALNATRMKIKDFFSGLTELANFERLLNSDIRTINEKEIRSSGYVIDTLEASLWCFMTGGSYKECVLKAVNLGNDTDTIAAVAGGLAGLYFKMESIPDEWINMLVKKEDIFKLCDNFSNRSKK